MSTKLSPAQIAILERGVLKGKIRITAHNRLSIYILRREGLIGRDGIYYHVTAEGEKALFVARYGTSQLKLTFTYHGD